MTKSNQENNLGITGNMSNSRLRESRDDYVLQSATTFDKQTVVILMFISKEFFLDLVKEYYKLFITLNFFVSGFLYIGLMFI